MQPCTQQEKIERMERALFGDDSLKQPGMIVQVNEIHDVLLTGNIIKKSVIWLFGGATAVIGLVLGVIEIMKEFKDN